MDNDGNIARLESLQFEDKKSTETNEASRKRKLENSSKEAEEEDPSDLWTSARAKLSEWVGENVADKVVTMLQHWEGTTAESSKNEFEKNVTLPAISDKEIRRNLHEWIRSCLKCARADTVDGRVQIWHVRFEKEMPNYGKFGNVNSNKRRNKWPSDRPDHLRFVLYKENADTSAAVKEICQRLSRGGGKPRVGYAGMKDKRGVTSQFCTLYKREPSEILGLNQKSGGGGNSSQKGFSVYRVGNFTYVENELGLGGLSGNRFDVVLRNVEATAAADAGSDRIQHTKECLEKAALSLRNHGFINYFGMQRFGRYYDTHKVGIAVLKGDFEAAINIILRPKPDEPPRFENARALWATRFADIAKDASLEEKSKAESSGAKKALKDMGRFMTCEISILKSLMHKPLDYKRAFGCIPKKLRLMFLHALQSYLWNHVASHRLETVGRQDVVVGDLVLTDDKTAKEGGSGTSGLGGKAVKVVDEDDVSSGTYSITDLVLPLVGTKVQYPQNNTGELFDSLLEKEGLAKENFSNVKDRELSLGGDYRKVICKPLDVDYEIRQYYDPLQPLLQTDLMRINDITTEAPPTKRPTIAAPETKETSDSGDTVLLAMVIGFTLPASSYATIALRELMKRPTSSDYQRKLLLEGSCERNIRKNETKE